MSTRRLYFGKALFGLMLGWVVTRIGFGDFGELNQMFTFGDYTFTNQSLRMFFSFAGGVGLALIVFQTVLRHPSQAPRIHRGVIPGGLLFGLGWAISGGCPAIPVIQVSSGYLPALVTIAGVLVGIRLCRTANARWFHLDRGSCSI